MRESILTVIVTWLGACGLFAAKPNFVIIFCDDLGYGDLSCFGHPTIHTPHLDRMAMEGQKWTNFYAAASVCTPSRAGLMTGRLPIRNGMCSNKRRVLFPDSAKGLPTSEITLAKALKQGGYATAAVGKWHLGHMPEYLPTAHGFDSYYGIPYSNDMDRLAGTGPKNGRSALMHPRSEYWNVPLMRDTAILERSPKQEYLTRHYTTEAVTFIKEQATNASPFFLYLAHSMPHVPIFASGAFQGSSHAGRYGDVIEEIDWSVGEIVRTLREADLADNTVVVFTSDNGPWLPFKTHGGSAGHLRDGKGSTWEGGMREPTVVWGPGYVQPGIVHELGSTLDLFPTFLDLAGIELPGDRVYDGGSLAPVIAGRGPSPRNDMFFYHGEDLYAVRVGEYKLHFVTKTEYVGQKPLRHETPLLYHLGNDPSEKFDIAAEHPQVVAALVKHAETHQASFDPPESQLMARLPRND